jgi:YVTN family beta-propeller protein
LEVVDDDRPLMLGGPKQRAVLAALLLHRGEVVSTDRLIDETWGERPPESAVKSVQVYVSNLRKALGDGFLVTRGRGYLLEAEHGRLDVDRFETLVAEGREALTEGNPQLARDRLREALALWRGRALADFAYEPFAQREAARLEEDRLAALEDRIDADLALGRHAALVGELDALVREHPLRERLQAQLMLALYRSGRQADALECYRRARRERIDELGIEPGRELQELERAILAQDPELGGARRPLPRPAGSRRVRRLLALGGLLLIAAAVGATVKLIGGDGGSAGLAGASSDSVARISAGRVGLTASFPVGGDPSSVAVAGGAVWALNAEDQTLTRVDLASRAERTYGTGGIPVALAAGDGSLWVVNAPAVRAPAPYPGAPPLFPEPTSVTRLDPVRALPLITIPLAQVTSSAPPSSYQIAVGAAGVWVINADGSVSRIDPSVNRVVQTVRGLDVSAIASGAEGTWAIENAGVGSIAQLAPGSRRAVRHIRLPTVQLAAPLSSIAVGAGAIWLTDSGTGALWRVDPRPVPVEQTIALAPGASDVAYGAGAVWVANPTTGTVSRIDPQTNRVTDTVAVGNTPGRVTTSKDGVWVAVAGTNGVSVPAASQSPRGNDALPAATCGPVLSGSDPHPQRLIVSDLPMRGGPGFPVLQMNAAITYVLREHDFRAGRWRLGYQACDDSTAQTGVGDPRSCTANAKAWIDHPMVIGVIGPYSSGCATAEIPVANTSGPLAILAPTNSFVGLTHNDPLGPPGLTQKLYPTGVRNYARIYPADDLEAAALAEFARRRNLSSVYVLSLQDDSYAQETAYYFRTAAQRLGLHLAGAGTWTEPKDDYNALAARVAASGATALYLGADGFGRDTGTLIRTLRRRLGSKFAILTDELALPTAVLFRVTGAAARGIYVATALAPQAAVGPAARQFLTHFSVTQHGATINLGALYAAQATEIMLGAIARSDASRGSVTRSLLATCTRTGILGSVCFNANGDPTSAPVTILQAVRPGTGQELNTDGTHVAEVIYAKQSWTR